MASVYCWITAKVRFLCLLWEQPLFSNTVDNMTLKMAGAGSLIYPAYSSVYLLKPVSAICKISMCVHTCVCVHTCARVWIGIRENPSFKTSGLAINSLSNVAPTYTDISSRITLRTFFVLLGHQWNWLILHFLSSSLLVISWHWYLSCVYLCVRAHAPVTSFPMKHENYDLHDIHYFHY